MNKMPSFALATIAASLGLLSTQASAATVYNFEDQSNGSYASISSTVDGITATLHRANGNDLTVVDVGPPSWQTHSLIGVELPNNPPAGIIANFSTALASASIQFGDAGNDDDTVWLEAWSGPNGTGTLLASNSLLYPASLNLLAGDSAIRSLAVSGTGIQSLLFYSTGGVNYVLDSIYWDNLTVSTAAVPEPTTLSLLSLGVVGIGFGKRRAAKGA